MREDPSRGARASGIHSARANPDLPLARRVCKVGLDVMALGVRADRGSSIGAVEWLTGAAVLDPLT